MSENPGDKTRGPYHSKYCETLTNTNNPTGSSLKVHTFSASVVFAGISERLFSYDLTLYSLILCIKTTKRRFQAFMGVSVSVHPFLFFFFKVFIDFNLFLFPFSIELSDFVVSWID